MATQMPSVASPDSTSGASVNTTSVARRRVTASRTVIARNAHNPACRKARTTVRLDSWIETGAPVASGASARTASTNRRSVSLSSASPLGNTSIRARPSDAIQSRLRSSGKVASVTGPACMAARS